MIRVNHERFLARLEELACIGATPDGGVERIALTDEDRRGRDRFADWMRQAGLRVEVDGIGNQFGFLEGTAAGPPVMIGSHLDTVGNGGRLDGSLGVIAALEVAAALREAGDLPRRALCIVSFTNEEGVRFQPDMMGSLVHAGGLELERALDVVGSDGARLGDELQRIGYAGSATVGRIRPHVFVELHIEQGPLLEAEELQVGVVEDLQGIYWTELILSGQANHAGTTPPGFRRDAGLAAARIVVAAREIADATPGQVATVGSLRFEPGLINVIPGVAKLTLDLRNADAQRLDEAQREIEARIAEIAAEESCEFERRELVRFTPVVFDPAVVELIEAAARRQRRGVRRMTSGAGHDAQMMARICPTSMIFVPSIGGISHNPREATRQEDLLAGLDLLATVVEELCNAG